MRIHGKTPKLRLQTIDALKVVTPGWFFDRRSILKLKLANYKKDSEAYRVADLSMQTIEIVCKGLMERIPEKRRKSVKVLIDNLAIINDTIWKLEDDIRGVIHSDVIVIREKDVCNIAIQIVDSNDRRCQIVKEIDGLFGYGSDEKVYK